MPKISKTNKTTTKKTMDLSCSMCGQIKKSTEFYQSWNPLHYTKRLPYCKVCLKEMCYDSNRNISVENVKKMLQAIDRPFLYQIFKSSAEDKMDTIGTLFKNLGLAQFRYSGWKDSIFEPQLQDKDDKDREIVYKKQKQDNFVLTDEMVEFFGAGFNDEEYKAMTRKYNFLKNNYPEKTNMHIEALKSYVKLKVKAEFAIASGQVGEAEKWEKLAKDAATAAKINPSQLSAADLQDGLSTFGQLSRAVEQAKDIIPILPQFKERPQDKVDFAIWCYINYIRDLKGMSPCQYKEIYLWYEERVKEYKDKFDFLSDKSEMIENDNEVEINE